MISISKLVLKVTDEDGFGNRFSSVCLKSKDGLKIPVYEDKTKEKKVGYATLVWVAGTDKRDDCLYAQIMLPQDVQYDSGVLFFHIDCSSDKLTIDNDKKEITDFQVDNCWITLNS